jgi:hypothetical protein
MNHSLEECTQRRGVWGTALIASRDSQHLLSTTTRLCRVLAHLFRAYCRLQQLYCNPRFRSIKKQNMSVLFLQQRVPQSLIPLGCVKRCFPTVKRPTDGVLASEFYNIS